ncbi:hypothetical protein AB895_3586 [Acinetobacter baumannii]|nr:hypothetical protein P668_0296 [Acinetobacter baumannii UH5207]EXF16344.1 hypothetical protein J601_3467 [Acinetobacter baumannii 831240]EXR23111.1 hypothetical protein J669_0336 [Acinetobacter baumannii 1295549]KMV06738.1 hypothetical protein AB895_3586 [Acinetobacter baumannii]
MKALFTFFYVLSRHTLTFTKKSISSFKLQLYLFIPKTLKFN